MGNFVTTVGLPQHNRMIAAKTIQPFRTNLRQLYKLASFMHFCNYNAGQSPSLHQKEAGRYACWNRSPIINEPRILSFSQRWAHKPTALSHTILPAIPNASSMTTSRSPASTREPTINKEFSTTIGHLVRQCNRPLQPHSLSRQQLGIRLHKRIFIPQKCSRPQHSRTQRTATSCTI